MVAHAVELSKVNSLVVPVEFSLINCMSQMQTALFVMCSCANRDSVDMVQAERHG